MKLKAVTILTLLLGVKAMAQTEAPVRGDYLEVRSSEVYTCACFYSGQSVTAGREAILAWQFTSGEFQGTSLGGLRVAAVIVADGNLGTPATLRRAALFFDSSSSNRQRQAAVNLLEQYYGAVLGKIAVLHTAAISFRTEGERVSVEIPGVLKIEVRKARLPQDAHPGSVLWYRPFISMTEATLAATQYYEYWGKDFERRWRSQESGITGYWGSFSLAA